MIRRISLACLLLITLGSFCLALALSQNATAQVEPTTDCAVFVEAEPPVHGTFLISIGGEPFRLIGTDGTTATFGHSPYSHSTHYDPISQYLRFFVRAYSPDDLTEDILQEEFTLNFWSLGTGEILHSRVPIPENTYRSVG